jgi:NitT/TauT family transport system substrate-binding protein
MKRILRGLLIFMSIALIHGASAFAEDVIRVAYPAPDAGYTALWAAKDLGIFDKHGVKVELVYIASTPIGMAALMAGEIDVISGAAGGILAANLAGASDLVLFAGMTRTLPFAMYAKPTITSIQQLKGMKIGVTRFGSTIDFAAQWLLTHAGMDPRKDVALIQVGSVPGIVGALKADSIAAGVLSFPSSLVAKKAGFRELADLAAMGLKYQKEAFGAKKGYLEKNKEPIKRFIAGLIASIDYIKTHQQEAVNIIAKYTKIDDRDALNTAYHLLIRKYLPAVPIVSPEHLTLILDDMAEKNPKYANVQPGRFIFDQYAREVAATMKPGVVQ